MWLAQVMAEPWKVLGCPILQSCSSSYVKVCIGYRFNVFQLLCYRVWIFCHMTRVGNFFFQNMYLLEVKEFLILLGVLSGVPFKILNEYSCHIIPWDSSLLEVVCLALTCVN